MATLLKGIGKLQVTGHSVSKSPTDEDFIKCLDYEELERKFGCFKYYPKFLNNYDYLTPEIKEMIGDKPVYLKANKHLKNFKNPGTKKTFVTEIDVETGAMTVKEKIEKKDRKARKEERRARREDRKERREERKDDRKDRREERKDDRKDRKEDRKDRREERKEDRKERRELRKGQKENGDVEDERHTALPILQTQVQRREGRQSSVATGNSGSTQNLGPMGAPAKVEPPKMANGDSEDFQFNNPFGEQSTLVSEKAPEPQATLMSRQNSLASNIKPRQESVHSGVKPRQNSVQTLEKPRKSTFSLKLRDMIMPHRHSTDNSGDLQRTQSYDQTRSLMTFNRGAKTGMLKITLNDSKARRMSEQIGTYNT